jgi:uncharacterized membrane protein YcaP (DUF421 family)
MNRPGKGSVFELLVVVTQCGTQFQALSMEGWCRWNQSCTLTLVRQAIRIECRWHGAFSLLKQKFDRANALLEGRPLVLVDNGRLLYQVMKSVQLDEQDILASARESQGLERLDQVRFAVLEVNGSISIIPKINKSPISEAA